ncbi:Na+-driven multidrug efflux pump [Oribacterium sp. KHPX15]|uniref:MATE family efflux transporter n=1 Tax=Oribacterium sp. KHPX15 TaxID=1855342 RepID=UPI000898DD45|nr:MATE family efflux transporter [Oribacterium sp. KHPX15]SEA04779.1 Na+-driven multidrug efflux pump [Oribacterium sp. KHPX15]
MNEEGTKKQDNPSNEEVRTNKQENPSDEEVRTNKQKSSSSGRNEKNELFETMEPGKALALMALPTVASQMIILIYNLADTWFIGRTNNPYMIGASSLGLSIYLAEVALANVFGTGGGSLMVRLAGEQKPEDARKVASYSLAMSAVTAFAFSLIVFLFLDPILLLLGASENTLTYGRQYVFMTTVIGGIPTVLSMCMPQLLRNSGYAKEAGIGVGMGSFLNVYLDPLFMFVLFPKGWEVIGAGVATMLSNVVSMIYFIIVFRELRDKTVLSLPRRIERITPDQKQSLYMVGIPAAFAIFLFDLVAMVTNRITVTYGDIPLAAMGIVTKLERIPVNIGLGVCLGMVPLVAYNYGSGNKERMGKISSLSRTVVVSFSMICVALFLIFAEKIVGSFISNEETIQWGCRFLRGRCIALPFMMLGYQAVNYMNAIGKGKVSFLLAIIRHIVLIIPLTMIMNHLWGINGLIWSLVVSDVLNTMIRWFILRSNWCKNM